MEGGINRAVVCSPEEDRQSPIRSAALLSFAASPSGKDYAWISPRLSRRPPLGPGPPREGKPVPLPVRHGQLPLAGELETLPQACRQGGRWPRGARPICGPVGRPPDSIKQRTPSTVAIPPAVAERPGRGETAREKHVEEALPRPPRRLADVRNTLDGSWLQRPVGGHLWRRGSRRVAGTERRPASSKPRRCAAGVRIGGSSGVGCRK